MEPFKTSQEVFEFLINRNKNFLGHFYFVIQLKSSKEYIGLINFFIDELNTEIGKVGIFIKKKFWKNGYALESLGKFLEKTFLSHNKLYVIEYVCNTNNLASFFLFNLNKVYHKIFNLSSTILIFYKSLI